MVKRITSVAMATISVIFSGLTFAGTMGAVCEPGVVTVPCEDKRWELAVEALYLRPVVGRDRMFIEEGTVFNSSANVAGDWGWGFGLSGSYHFSTGSDLSLDWIHYDVISHLPHAFFGVTPSFFGLTPVSASEYRAKVLNRFDRVNATLGQVSDVSLLKRIHFFAGLQYAKIYHEFFNYYDLAFPPEFTEINEYNKANFSGVGPVVGIDYSYGLPWWGLNVEAKFDGSILYGTSRTLTGFVLGPAGLITNGINVGRKRLVPSVDAKLGLSCNHDLGEGILSLYAGYEVLNYFNALVNLSPSVYSLNTNYGLYGPYAGISWKGMA